MGRDIVRQPDGRYAVWSTVVDDWIVENATEKQLIEWYRREQEERAIKKMRKWVNEADAGETFQTYEEYEDWRQTVHGDCSQNGGGE